MNKRKFCLLICVVLWSATPIIKAQVATEVAGSILISNTENESPDPGTIRFNSSNSDFEGWNGHFWASLTGFQTDTISDIDGNIYKTAMIGTQRWMLENLKTAHYRDGTPILHAADNTTWSTNTSGAYSLHGHAAANDSIYGKLYNWYAVSTQQLCPSGWKVPFEADWDTLTNYLGGEDKAANYLKEVGTQHWSSTSDDVTNSSGFTSIGGGNRNHQGSGWAGNRAFAFYWALTVGPLPYNGEGAFSRRLEYANSKIFTAISNKNNGYSVRCIQTN